LSPTRPIRLRGEIIQFTPSNITRSPKESRILLKDIKTEHLFFPCRRRTGRFSKTVR